MRRTFFLLFVAVATFGVWAVAAQEDDGETTPEPATAEVTEPAPDAASTDVAEPEATDEAVANDDEPLLVSEIVFMEEIDAFGQTVPVGVGAITNQGSMAYESITVFADLYNSADEVIGEGLGVMVNACGTGLLPAFALQPGETQTFRMGLDFFGAERAIVRTESFLQSRAIDPAPALAVETFPNIREVDDREVVMVEWEDANTFRYGVGCDADVFSNLEWFRYDIGADEVTRIIHPAEPQITEALLTQVGLTDPIPYNRSYLTFAPTSRRIVYQTDINTMLTAEQDGSFKRLIYENLSRFSLHGYVWLPEGRFLAYYYGAIGDPVRYFTASVEGQRISPDIYNITPSFTVPGPTPDGVRTVVTLDVEGVVGYYLFHTLSRNFRLLFEAEPPGNNWPAPVYVAGPSASEADIYIVRPVDNVATLQCFDLETDSLTTLTTLPFELTQDDRAWTWLSPDGNTLAVAANGNAGGVWLVGIASLGGCNGPAGG